jgi:hypothetical protein
VTKLAAKSSRTREKFREIKKKTTNEKISRMNRIIKTDLQEMLNVIVIADIAAIATEIFHAASQSFEQTATSQIVKNRQER